MAAILVPAGVKLAAVAVAAVAGLFGFKKKKKEGYSTRRSLLKAFKWAAIGGTVALFGGGAALALKGGATLGAALKAGAMTVGSGYLTAVKGAAAVAMKHPGLTATAVAAGTLAPKLRKLGQKSKKWVPYLIGGFILFGLLSTKRDEEQHGHKTEEEENIYAE